MRLIHLAVLAALITPATAVAQPRSWTIQQLPFSERNLNQSWSPDSRRIAYGDESGAICVYHVASGAVTTLTRPGTGGQPTWTNDGRILFSLRPEGAGAGPVQNQTRTGPPRIFSMNDDGSDLEEVEISDEFPRDVNYWDSSTPAKISPDGVHVSFTTRPESQYWEVIEGRIVRTEQGTLRLQDMQRIIPADDNWNEAKGYTRDGSLIIGSTRADGDGGEHLNSDVFLYDHDSGRLQRVTRHPAWDETLDRVGKTTVINSDRDNPSAGPAAEAPNAAVLPDRLGVIGSVPLTQTGMTSHDLYLGGPEGDAGSLVRLTHQGDRDKGGWASTQPKLSPTGRHIRFQQAQGLWDGQRGRAERTMLLTFASSPRSVLRSKRASRAAGRSAVAAPRGES